MVLFAFLGNANEWTEIEVFCNSHEELLRGNKQRAAISLGCTVRHINRLIKGYKEHGKVFFVHGNKGRKPSHAYTKQLIVDLYCTKYEGSNLTHYSELLSKFESINVSQSTIRNILAKSFILSPKAKKATKKNLTKHLKEMKKIS